MIPLAATKEDSWKILGDVPGQGIADLLIWLLLLLAGGALVGLHRYRSRQNRKLIGQLDAQRQQIAEALDKTEQIAHEKTALLKSILESPQSVVIFALDPSYRYLQFTNAHKETIKKNLGCGHTSGDEHAPCDRGRRPTRDGETQF
ncbi:MAG: hypothetical protein WCP35_06340 [Verrucomicrobiota bacterium]